MNTGLEEVFPPTPEVWAELAQHEIAGDHQFGRAVQFLEEGGTDRNLLAERLGIKVDYADWLLHHARKMKSGIIRVVVSEKNDGRETAAIQAHHYRYVLDSSRGPMLVTSTPSALRCDHEQDPKGRSTVWSRPLVTLPE